MFYTIEMNNRRITCDRDTLIALINIPQEFIRAIYELTIGATITVSGWNITRIVPNE